MNPEATYDLIISAIHHKDWEATIKHVNDLWDWLSQKGSPPNRPAIDLSKLPEAHKYWKLRASVKGINIRL